MGGGEGKRITEGLNIFTYKKPYAAYRSSKKKNPDRTSFAINWKYKSFVHFLLCSVVSVLWCWVLYAVFVIVYIILQWFFFVLLWQFGTVWWIYLFWRTLSTYRALSLVTIAHFTYDIEYLLPSTVDKSRMDSVVRFLWASRHWYT